MKTNRLLSPYDVFLIVGVMVTSFAYNIISKDIDILGSIAGISGVLCVVLVAKGSIWNYLFGVVNVSLYALISFNAALYGDAALNALYYFPMQFIGWALWKKRGASTQKDGDSRVKARRMSWGDRLRLFILLCGLIVGVGFVLKTFNDPQPFKDSATTVLSIVAQALMAMAFMEQWALWIVNNIISVAMWSICVARGEAHAPLMVIMWSFYLMNSINGLRVWLKLSNESPF